MGGAPHRGGGALELIGPMTGQLPLSVASPGAYTSVPHRLVSTCPSNGKDLAEPRYLEARAFSRISVVLGFATLLPGMTIVGWEVPSSTDTST